MSSEHKPIETRLIGGFLGAGKTTFILEHLKRAGARVAVLVNEFGKLGIDGDLIRLGGGIEVVEMPGGCVCCSQRQGLVASVRQIAEEIRPELLLIEPSGVAEISELLQVLSEPSLAGVIRIGTVITVIDAETFLEFSEPDAFGLFFMDQVACADLVLANKSDLVSRETLDAIEERIATHNPGALVLRTEFCRIKCEIPQGSQERTALPGRRPPLGMDCMSAVPARLFSEESLSRLLREIDGGRFGRIIRGKGLVQVGGRGWLNLQIASGRVSLEQLPTSAAPRLTLIGWDLKPEELEKFLS